MKDSLIKALREVIVALNYEETEILVHLPKNPDHGDFATNIALQIGGKLNQSPKEIWINTSEAEILPALNPSYEVSKSLIGQLVSFKKNLLDKNTKKKFKIKKIILGPFKSELNPIGILSPAFVSEKIYTLAHSNNYLIIISPNPISYILFPIKELYYYLYCQLLKKTNIYS